MVENNISRSHYVMDYETMANLFVAVFEDVKSKDRKIFIKKNNTNKWSKFKIQYSSIAYVNAY